MDINLNDIIDDIIALQQKTSEDICKAFLVKSESELKQYDSDLQTFFLSLQRQLHKSLLKEEKNNLIIQLREKYLVLSGFFKEMGLLFITKAHQLNDSDYKSNLFKIGENLISVSKLVPDYKKLIMVSSDEIYNFAKALGGVYLRFGQNSLPTVAGHDDGKKAEVDGVCGGMVLEWAQQSVAKGTPNYPITSNLLVLKRQRDQQKERAQQYNIVGKKTSVCHLNLIEKLKTLQDHLPHYVVISNANVRGSHALGIRKQKNYVEIMDPNYGNFFFRDVESAGIWLAVLLQRYRIIYHFPAEKILFYHYRADCLPIMENQFISMKNLDAAVIQSHSDKGNIRLLQLFKTHISNIIYQSNDVFYDFISAIKHFFYCLTTKDSQDLRELITCLENNGEYQDLFNNFISQADFNALKTKLAKKTDAEFQQIKATFKKLISISPRNLLPPSIITILDDIKKLNQRVMMEMHQLATELSSLKKDNPPNKDEIDKLNFKIEVLNKVRKKLRMNQIDSKLIAGFYGKISYSEIDAKRELNLLFGADITQPYPFKELDHWYLIGQIESLKNALSLLDENLKNRSDWIDETLYAKQHQLMVLKKHEKIAAIFNFCDEMRNKIVSNEDYNRLLDEIMKAIPNFLDFPESGVDYKYSDYLEILETNLETFIPPIKYSADEIEIMNNLFQLLDKSSPRSIQYALLGKARTEGEYQNIYQDLLQSANELRLLLIKSIDPDQEKLPISYFIDLVRKMTPTIDDWGCNQTNEYDFSLHIKKLNLPQFIIALVSSIKEEEAAAGTNPNVLSLLFDDLIKKFNTSLKFYREGNIYLSDCLNQMLNDLAVNPSLPLDAINEQVIRDAITRQKLTIENDLRITAAPHRPDPVVAAPHRPDPVVAAGREEVNEASSENQKKLERIITIIQDEAFWKSKVHFSFSAAPKGVMEMRKALLQNTQDKDEALRSLAQIAENRTFKTAVPCCFFSRLFRAHTTSMLYKTIKQLEKNKVDHTVFSELTTQYEAYTQRKIKYLSVRR